MSDYPAAQQLRELADKVENGKVLLQRIQTTQEAKRDDYTYSAMILEFAETGI